MSNVIANTSSDIDKNLVLSKVIAEPSDFSSVEYKPKINKGYTNRMLLINPPTDRTQFIGADNYFPLGLISLATILKKNEDIVKILDANNYFFHRDINDTIISKYIEKDIISNIDEFKPNIIGIGGTFSGAFKYTKLFARLVKKHNPDIPIIVGGNHASTFKGMILKRYRYIDYIIIGESEYTLPELLECLFQNNGEGIEKIDGLSYRKGSHRNHPYDVSQEKNKTPQEDIVTQEKYRYITNLDELPFFNEGDIVNTEEYYMDTSDWYNPHNIAIGQPYSVITSRSCPMRCTFCNMWHVHGPKIRYRSATNVVDEIESLYHKYNVRYFQIMDDNFTYDKKRVISVMNQIVKRGLKIQFDTPNGIAINRLDEDVIQAMVDGGLVRISIAIESGSEKIRQSMKKGLGQKAIYKIANELAKHDHVFINSMFIVGMPDETRETLEETREMIKKLPLDKFSINYATPFPGTAMFNQVRTLGLLQYDVEDYVDMSGNQSRSDSPHFIPPALTKNDLIDFVKWADEYQMELTKNSKKVDPRGVGDLNIPVDKNIARYWEKRLRGGQKIQKMAVDC